MLSSRHLKTKDRAQGILVGRRGAARRGLLSDPWEADRDLVQAAPAYRQVQETEYLAVVSRVRCQGRD